MEIKFNYYNQNLVQLLLSHFFINCDNQKLKIVLLKKLKKYIMNSITNN